MRWFEYLSRRLLWAILVIVSVSIITFTVARVIPSDPAAAWVGTHPTQEQIARARIELGLDQPLWTQYYFYARDLLRGDFGTSIHSHQPIATGSDHAEAMAEHGCQMHRSLCWANYRDADHLPGGI